MRLSTIRKALGNRPTKQKEAATCPQPFDALPNRAKSESGDQTVAAHHAIIRREGRNSAVSQAGGGQVLINRRPVAGRQAVRSGDRVKIGGTLFIFRERAQAAQT
jgi:hypothetical protein